MQRAPSSILCTAAVKNSSAPRSTNSFCASFLYSLTLSMAFVRSDVNLLLVPLCATENTAPSAFSRICSQVSSPNDAGSPL
eukprot:8624488-Pyramimonas_sp.AAC.1